MTEQTNDRRAALPAALSTLPGSQLLLEASAEDLRVLVCLLAGTPPTPAALAKAAGARRCIPLNVSGPFHTRLMAPAGDALARRFETESFGEMRVPVLFNCLGREKAAEDSIPALLVRQVQSSVHMEDTLRRLGELGVDHILEVGPGNALSGFVKQTLPGVACTAVETPEQLDAVLTAWKEAE